MSEAFVDDRHSETADERLLRQPTVDMGTPIDLLNAAARLVGDDGGMASAGMPPLLCSQPYVVSADIKTETGELKPVDSMPYLMPMISDVENKDVDTEGWVPVVSHFHITQHQISSLSTLG